MSWTSPARLATRTLTPSSVAMWAASHATSFEWESTFCPYEVRYCSRPSSLQDLGVEVRLAELDRGRLAVAEDLLVQLLLDLADHLLDAAGMDAAVQHEPLERQPRDLAADRVEARQQHCARRVVDDQVHAGRGLEGPDVAPLAADDPPLHLVVGEVHHRDRALHHVLGRDPLDGEGDHAARPVVGLLVRLLLDAADRSWRRPCAPRSPSPASAPPWPARR